MAVLYSRDWNPETIIYKAGKMPTFPFVWWENAQEKYKAKKLTLEDKSVENIKFELRPKFYLPL